VWGLAMARFPLGVAQVLRLQIDDARETFRVAVEVAERSRDPMVKALVVHGSAMAEFFAGDFEAAERLNDASMQLTEGTGVSWISEVPGRTLKASIYREQGRLDEGLALLEGLESAEAGLYEEARAASVKSEILSDLGRASEAVETARQGIDEADEDVCGKAMCHRAKARAHSLLGDAVEAERLLRVELDLLSSSDWEEERVQALALLARVLDEQGRHDEAWALVDQAQELVRRFPPGPWTSKLEALLMS
jgi:tetratricopeptide (TPR) repeat protein